MEAIADKEMAALEDRHWWFVGRRSILERFAMGRFVLPFGVSYIISAQPAATAT